LVRSRCHLLHAGRWRGLSQGPPPSGDAPLTVRPFCRGGLSVLYRVPLGRGRLWLPRASAWPPHKEVFKEDAALARREQRVTLQASNLPVRYVAWSLDTDDPVLCLATRAVEDDRLCSLLKQNDGVIRRGFGAAILVAPIKPHAPASAPGLSSSASSRSAYCCQAWQATRSDTARRLIQFFTLLEQCQ
jgi:hypothetical protein